MKKLKWLVLVMCLALGLSVFVACGGDDGKKDNGNNTVAVTDISLPATFTLDFEQVKLINASVEPFEADEAIVWASSNPSVVSVSTAGQAYGVAKLTAGEAGTANVTATAGGKTATCVVTVNAYVVPYWFLAGQSAGMYFDWKNYPRANVDVNAPRLLKPVDGSDEKVFSTTVDLFVGDMFKIAKVIEATGGDDHWGDHFGGLLEGSNPDKLELNGETDETELETYHKLSTGDPPSYQVKVEGKYEVKLDLSGENPVVSFKKVGNTDPVAWSYDIFGHGLFAPATGWANSAALNTAKFDKDHLTGNCQITLSENDQFGFKTTNPSSWGGKDKMSLDTGVTGIDLSGDNAKCTVAGTYDITVTLDADGNFVSIVFTGYTAPAAE